MGHHGRVALLIGLIAACLFQNGCGNGSAIKPRFVRQIDWIGKGTWLKADTHVHTKYSDGEHTVQEIVRKAKHYGVNVLAITDHADKHLKAATREYFEDINVQRRNNPDLILFAGLEWNLPPWGGDEHATVLIHPDLDEWSILSRFKNDFDDMGRVPHTPDNADRALRWLEQHAVYAGIKPVIVYEHPSRKRSPSMAIVPDMVRWRSVNDLVIGISGAPGHQRYQFLGGYKDKEKTIDRWDPCVARVGDAWDTLLAKGLDVWAAHAPSDFHNDLANNLHDFWPGQFSETWLYVPEKTPAGVLRAFHAGTFFGVHGHILREAELTVEATGLPRPAAVGEVVELPPGSRYTVKFHCVVPVVDYSGRLNPLDSIELIGITPEEAKVLSRMPLDDTGAVEFETMEVPPGGIVLRARCKRVVPGGPNLFAYTNSIRIQTGS